MQLVFRLLFPTILIYAGALNAGQAMIFFPAVVHFPVHCVLCDLLYVFLFPALYLNDLPGKYQSICYPLIRPEEIFHPLLPYFVLGCVAIILNVLYQYRRD